MYRFFFACVALVFLFPHFASADEYDLVKQKLESLPQPELQAIFLDGQRSDIERVAASAIYHESICRSSNSQVCDISGVHKDVLTKTIQTSQNDLTIAHAYEVLFLDSKIQPAFIEGSQAFINKTLSDRAKSICSSALSAYYVRQFVSGDNNSKEVAAKKLWLDPILKEKYRAQLEAHYVTKLDSADEYVVMRMLNDLWGDPQSRENHRVRLEVEIVKQLDSADKYKNICAYEKLWNDPQAKKTYIDKLEAYLLANLASVDRAFANPAFSALSGDPTLKLKHLDTLVAYMISHLESGDIIQKSTIEQKLWDDPLLKEKYLEKLTAHYISQLDVEDQGRKSKAVNYLWNDLKLRETYREKLGAYFLVQLESGTENQKSYAAEALWSDEELRETYRAKLEAYYIGQFESGDENTKACAAAKLWNDPKSRETHHAKLEAHFGSQFETGDENKKSNMAFMLWYDLVSREKFRDKLEAYYVAELEKNQSHVAAYNALWNDAAAQKKYHNQIFKKLAKDLESTDPNTKSNAVFNIWYYDAQLKEAHRQTLEAFIANELQSGNVVVKSHAAHKLWGDLKSRAIYRTQLEAYYLGQLDAGDGNLKPSPIERLWDDLTSREAHRAALEAYLLRQFDAEDEEQVFEAAAKLWDDLTSRATHRARLDSYIWDSLCSEDDMIVNTMFDALMDDHANFDAGLIALLFRILDEATEPKPQGAALLLLTSDTETFNQYITQIQGHFDRLIASYPDQHQYKLYAYMAFGEPYKTHFDEFIRVYWSAASAASKENLVGACYEIFAQENQRVQELMLVYTHEGGELNTESSVSIYADLCRKVILPYEHRLSPLRVTFKKASDDDDDDDGVEHRLEFKINPKIFCYAPVTHAQLATLQDVDAVLGDYKQLDEKVIFVRENPAFQKYFTSAGEEPTMLQAMVKRYRTMEQAAGLKVMVKLMHDMYQCKTGMNQAIWDHYSLESLPLPKAGLDDIKVWTKRLSDTEKPYVTDEQVHTRFDMSRAELLTLIDGMTSKGHFFHAYMTEHKTEDAERVKALLGVAKAREDKLDPEDRAAMRELLIDTIGTIKALSDPTNFKAELNRLCIENHVYLPANKFGDTLSVAAIQSLIAGLKASEVEGRGELVALTQEMQEFVGRDDVKTLLNDFASESEAANRLRILMEGFVKSGSAIGLLNLAQLAKIKSLVEAINETYQQGKLDANWDMLWRNLIKTAMGEMQGLKRESISALTDKLLNRNGAHADSPHTRNYIDGWLGSAIGLRHANQLPKFDSDIAGNSKHIQIDSVQQILDLFHEDFTPEKLVRHFNEMLIDNKLNIVDGMTGRNEIWSLIRSAAVEFLAKQHAFMDEEDAGNMLYQTGKTAKGATTLAMALLLSHIGILEVSNTNYHN